MVLIRNGLKDYNSMFNGKKIIALLPMKANSERVPGKNFKSLAGQPLFTWILNTLCSIEIIDNIIINTDAAEILNRHSAYLGNSKIIIRKRKKDLCGDSVSMNLVIKDDLENVDSDIYLMTHTTNPLLSSSIITKMIDFYYNNLTCYDSLFTVNKYQTRFYKKDGEPINHSPNKLIRTQDLEPWYEENSCLYLFTKKSFNKTGARIGETPFLFEIPKIESIDIDDNEDFGLAEAVLLYKT